MNFGAVCQNDAVGLTDGGKREALDRAARLGERVGVRRSRRRLRRIRRGRRQWRRRRLRLRESNGTDPVRSRG